MGNILEPLAELEQDVGCKDSLGLTDSESNLTLPNEYDKAPNLSHLIDEDSVIQKEERLENSETKKERANSGLPALNSVRYSCDEDNVNSPVSKPPKLV